MKVLSMTQPWASLLAFGEKRFETRGWSTPHRGLLAIHAAKGFEVKYRDLARSEPYLSALRRHRPEGAPNYWPNIPRSTTRGINDLPLGRIIAVVGLVDVLSIDRMGEAANGTVEALKQPWCGVRPAEREWDFGDYSSGRYAWITRDVRRLAKPMRLRAAARGRMTCPARASGCGVARARYAARSSTTSAAPAGRSVCGSSPTDRSWSSSGSRRAEWTS